MDSQMKKGVLELCLLRIIAEGETYGYALMSQMTAAFPDISESTVYAVLRRIQSDGYAETYAGEQSGGPVRRYFRLTVSGQERLDAAIGDWNSLVQAVRGLGIP